MRELHLFSGVGGGILGGMLLGHTCVCAVEIDHYCRKVLLQRQRDGIFPQFPIWDDIRTFDGKPWRGLVDVVCGGFPCQDISSANNIKGKGGGVDNGSRSGSWKDMRRVVCEIKPGWIFVENSPMLAFRGLGTVLRDLANAGYDARWGVFSANEVGAPHQRDRLFVLANADGIGWFFMDKDQFQGRAGFNRADFGAWRDLQDELQIPMGTTYDPAVCGVLRNDDGLAEGVDRVKAVGNGQVPSVVKLAWKILA